MGINVFCGHLVKNGTMFRQCGITNKNCKYGYNFMNEHNCKDRVDPIRPDPPKILINLEGATIKSEVRKNDCNR